MTALNEHVLNFMPAAGTVLQVGPIALLYTTLTALLCGHLRSRRDMRAPYTRKIFHFSIFSMATAVHFVWALPGVVVFGATTSLVVLAVVACGSGFPAYEALARPTDAPHRTMFILIPLATTAAGGVLSNLLFPAYAYIGYLITGWGDAVGEPVGTRWGRHRYRVPSLGGVPATRSLEGSAGVFLVGSFAAVLGLVIAGVGMGAALVIGCGAGLAGALVEAFSNHGTDNLTVQLAGAGAAWLIAMRVLG